MPGSCGAHPTDGRNPPWHPYACGLPTNEVPHVKFRSPLTVALVTAALLFGSACSSDDDTSSDTTTTQAGSGTDSTTEPGSDDDDAASSTVTEPEGETTEPEGGETGSAGESDYVDALARGMVDSTRPPGAAQFTQEQADCLAPRIVSTLGVDRLEAEGITVEDLEAQGTSLGFEDFGLDQEAANAVYDSFGECGLDLVEVFVDGLTAGAMLDAETQACVEGVVTDEKLRALMVGLMVVGEAQVDGIPAVAEFGRELEACAG